MCGRYVQSKAYRDYQRCVRAVARGGETSERRSWNVAPSTTSLVAMKEGTDLVLQRLTWGLLGANGLISNARVETASEKPTFRSAWRESRGIVPVDGWYEWQTDLNGRKQPYFFTPPGGEPVLLSALIQGDRFTLITTETHSALRAVHTRRPAAIPLDRVEQWCDPGAAWTPEELQAALVPEDAYQQVAVGTGVNSTRHDGPELISPRKPQLSQAGFSF